VLLLYNIVLWLRRGLRLLSPFVTLSAGLPAARSRYTEALHDHTVGLNSVRSLQIQSDRLNALEISLEANVARATSQPVGLPGTRLSTHTRSKTGHELQAGPQ
jgi:hypothetical protein